MATIENQVIYIREVSRNSGYEICVDLSNGLIFKSQYDLCRNLTVNSLYSSEGNLLSMLELVEPGNRTQDQLLKLEDILKSDDSLELIRERALKNSFYTEACT